MSDAAARPLHVAVTMEQPWQPVPGGSATYALELTRALAGSTLVTGLSAWHRGPAPEPWRPTCRVVSFPLPRAALYELWQRTRVPLAEWAVPDADVVHATTWAVPRTRRPLVVTVHDLAFLSDPSHFTRRGVAFFSRALARTRDEAAAVIVPSLATRDECLAAGLERERLHVVPHGARLEPTSDLAIRTFKTAFALPDDYLLWVGTREPRKNLSTVLSAWRAAAPRLPATWLVLVGPPGWGSDATMVAPLPPRTRVLGGLSRAHLSAAYQGARAFCFPSLREGFGLPVLEAMTAGLPVVTSRGTACAEVAGDAGLLVDPLDEQALTEGIVEACTSGHDQLAARSALRGAQFSWSAAAKATRLVYDCVASR